jgi:chromosomal replication initiation ATPase DnaA
MRPAAAGGWRWRQLPLPFPHQPQFAGADFLADTSNAEAVAWLARTPDWPHSRLALWGGEGSGKTHLLHLWAARVGADLLAGPMLPRDVAPPMRPVAVDDADAAAERPLLHLLNAANEAGQPVLLAGRTPPSRWPVALPDLASRLRAVTAVEIRPADDAMLRALLARLLAERQFAVPQSVQEWLLLRLPRTPAALREAAARLDRAGLAAGQRMSHALAAAAIADMPGVAQGGAIGCDNFAPDKLPSSTTPPCLL